MNPQKGIFRIKFVGLALMTWLFPVVLVIMFRSSPLAQAVGPFTLLFFFLGVLGICIFVVAWIIEGFCAR